MSLSGEAVLYADSPGDKKAQEAARKERRRRKVIKELFETEKTYLHHLELIHKFFDFPLRFACLVPDSIHSRIFSNLEPIREVNVTLLEQMEQTTVGQAFSQLGPFLKLYSMYANNHQYALNTLQEWQSKSQEFTKFVTRQENQAELMGLKLPSLLITPVQRIPRYKMLLEDLLASTPLEHHDYEKLKEASNKIADIASHINEHIRQNENFMKMLLIQRNFDSSAPKLLAPGRQFVREGALMKVSRKGGKSFERMFFLFSDILLYGKPKFLDGGGRSYTCSCVLPLRHCKVEPVFITNINNNTDSGGVFKITCKEESLVLYSEDQNNAKEWSREVEKAIRKLCDDRQTLRKPSSNKIPLRGRSLRKHRQNQKRMDIKIPGKTPHRPLSQVSINSEENDDSGSYLNVKMRRPFKEVCSVELAGDENTIELSPMNKEDCDSPVLRKKRRNDNNPPRDSADVSGVSLSDISGTISESFSTGPSERSSVGQDSLTAEEFDGVRQSIRQYSISLRGSRGRLRGNRPVSQISEMSHDESDLAVDVSVRKHTGPMSLQDPAPALSTMHSSLAASSASVWFPPNSPAHKYSQHTTVNMRLRSYFKRFKKAKKGMTQHCSPFKLSATCRSGHIK